MLILLPPSEGKTAPPDGPRLDLATLTYPELTATRRALLRELVTMCRSDPTDAARVLGLGPKGHDDIQRNAHLRMQPCAAAIDVYSGVLFDHLGFRTLARSAQSRAGEQVLISSALWGLIRPDDHIPAYRLSGTVTLPQSGSMRSVWRARLTPLLARDHGLVVDLRSGTYRDLAPPPERHESWVDVRVVTERAGRRITVSHDNKATKGRIARTLLESRSEPATAAALVKALSKSGLTVEHTAPRHIDVVIT